MRLLDFAARAAKQRAPTQVTAYAGRASTAEGLPGIATRAGETSAQNTKTVMTHPRGLLTWQKHAGTVAPLSSKTECRGGQDNVNTTSNRPEGD